MSEPPETIFDPFHHDGEPPNMLQPDQARMLELNAPTMVDPGAAVEVDPDSATVVQTDQADLVDTDQVIDVDDNPLPAPEPIPAEAPTDVEGTTDDLVPADPQVIAIVGAPGAGKSTVGRLLAERLGVGFTDVDARIEQQTGRTIREIFADQGEPAFRALEEQATAEALAGTGVVALGGGAVLSPAVREQLADVTVVWLEVTAAKAINRAGLDQARPLLMGNVRGTLIKLLAERTPLYQQVATHTVTNDGDDPAVVVDQILGLL
ncbi:shikimate kinase [Propionibacteriaceae bacterium Y1685]|uniref:shikimate kinase n=1 Tax=Microlunatus sp. Y1700 TaxID=3418487 RepID=UPI003B7F3E8C